MHSVRQAKCNRSVPSLPDKILRRSGMHRKKRCPPVVVQWQKSANETQVVSLKESRLAIRPGLAKNIGYNDNRGYQALKPETIKISFRVGIRSPGCG